MTGTEKAAELTFREVQAFTEAQIFIESAT